MCVRHVACVTCQEGEYYQMILINQLIVKSNQLPATHSMYMQIHCRVRHFSCSRCSSDCAITASKNSQQELYIVLLHGIRKNVAKYSMVSEVKRWLK